MGLGVGLLGGGVEVGWIEGTVVGDGVGRPLDDGDGAGDGEGEGEAVGDGEGCSPLQSMWSVPVRKMSGVPSHALPSTIPDGRPMVPVYSAGSPFTK